MYRILFYFSKDAIMGFFSSLNSATVNNLQAKVDTLEKSNTKLTEEVSVLEIP
jgi:citrate lyase synthetase